MASSPSDSNESFSSRLSSRAERLSAEILSLSIEHGWQTADDFIDHFSIEGIVEAVARNEDMKVKLLVETTGTHERIAAKKSPASAGEDVRLALDEGTTTADAIIGLFDADDWIRLLGPKPIWEFLTRDRFWNSGPEDGAAFTEAVERTAAVVTSATQQGLLSGNQLLEAVGYERFLESLTMKQLQQALAVALDVGKRREPFTPELLLDIATLEEFLEQVPLNRVWNDVVGPHVAQPLDLGSRSSRNSKSPGERAAEPEQEPASQEQERETRGSSAPPSERPARAHKSNRKKRSESPPPQRSSEAPPSQRPMEAVQRPRVAKTSTPPPPSRRQAAPPRARSQPPPRKGPTSMPPPPPPMNAYSSSPPAAAPPPLRPSNGPPPLPQDAMMAKTVARLERIERLPARHMEFPAAVLHSIESMYGELATVSDPQQQLNIIKEAFPNDQWRARAMLALLELLNPSLLARAPTIANETADALAIRLLSEERQLSRNAASSQPGHRS